MDDMLLFTDKDTKCGWGSQIWFCDQIKERIYTHPKTGDDNGFFIEIFDLYLLGGGIIYFLSGELNKTLLNF